MGHVKFWVVWCPDRGPCKRIQATEDEARQEAERLAAAERRDFYILEAKAVVGPVTPIVTYQLLV